MSLDIDPRIVAIVGDVNDGSGIHPHLRPNGHAAEPTWRTLADVPDDPPRPLLLGMWEPDGPNLANASGGTGKGMTMAWTCGEVIALGMKPMVYDPENRPREWSRRTSGLGIDRSQIVYVQPSDLPKVLVGRPLWDVAEYLGRVVKASGSDLLIIDSILAGIGVGEERLKSDAQAPYLYVAALDALGIPSISLATPPKNQPDGDPFGSVAWLNAMRLTWQGTRAGGEGHRIRWSPRKRNERGHIAGVILAIEYGRDGRPCRVVRSDDEATTRQWLWEHLEVPTSLADLAAEWIAEDEREQPYTKAETDTLKERLRAVLNRMAKAHLVANDARGPRSTWARLDPDPKLKLTAPWPL